MGREKYTFCVGAGDGAVGSSPIFIIIVFTVLLLLYDFVSTETEGCACSICSLSRVISPSLRLIHVGDTYACYFQSNTKKAFSSYLRTIKQFQ